MVLDMSARLGCAVAGALRLPHARPGQGHDARGNPAQAHRARRAQRRVCCGRSATACACPTECRELADVVAREHGNIHRSARIRRRGAGAAAGALRRLSQAPAFRAGTAGLRMRRARPAGPGGKALSASARACWPRWPRRRRWPRMKSRPQAQQAQARGPADRRDDPQGAGAGGGRYCAAVIRPAAASRRESAPAAPAPRSRPPGPPAPRAPARSRR